MEKSRYGATAAEVADTLTPGMRAALGTGHASSHGATVISNPQTIKALRSRGLIGSDNRWTALGFQVAAIVLSGRVNTIDDLHSEALGEDLALAADAMES